MISFSVISDKNESINTNGLIRSEQSDGPLVPTHGSNNFYIKILLLHFGKFILHNSRMWRLISGVTPPERCSEVGYVQLNTYTEPL